MARESHVIEAMVRGYHVYKEIWCAAVGEELSCMREVENYRDPFAVAVSITRFTSALADSMDDDGTVVDRGPRGSGSLVVSLDALK